MLLTITADGFGARAELDSAIAEAARLRAVDCVGVLIGDLRGKPQRLIESGVGLALQLGPEGGAPLAQQWEEFRKLIGREPDCLACRGPLSPVALAAVGELGCERGVAVSSTISAQRERLRELGATAPDWVAGAATEPFAPPELKKGWTEWITHPGRGEELQGLVAYELPAGARREPHQVIYAELEAGLGG